MLFPILGISQTKEQVKDLIKNNNLIGMSKDSLVTKFPDGFNSDTLNGIKYDVVKGRINKILVTCFLTQNKKNEQQTCFHCRFFIVITVLQSSDISNILNTNFKRIKNQWEQYREKDTLNWSSKETLYTVTLESVKK